LPPNRDIQEAVPVQMAEFAPAVCDKFSAAKPVNLKPDTVEAQSFLFQHMHGCQPASAKQACKDD
jgi:hypothetical protein